MGSPPDDEALRGHLIAAANTIYGDETAEICALLLDACSGVLAKLQGPVRRSGLAALLLAGAQSSSHQQARRLSEVLKACDLTLEAAVRELSPAVAALEVAVAGVLGSGVPLERRLQLRELKQSFVFNTLLAKKTRDMSAEYFSSPPSPDPHAPLGFFWLLFCTARAALLPPQADLVTSFALLLACMHFMLRHAPWQHIRPDRQQQLEQGDGADELLLMVAASHGAAEHAATVRQLAGMLQLLLAQVLQPAVEAVPASGATAVAKASDVTWLRFPGLVDADGQVLAAAVDTLQQHNQRLTADADIDAIPFLMPTLPAAPEDGAAATAPTPTAMDLAAGFPAVAETQTHVSPAGPADDQTTAAEAASRRGAAAMDVDAAAAAAEPAGPAEPEVNTPAAAASGEEPGSPVGRQMSEPVASTPLRRSRVAPSRTTSDATAFPAGGGEVKGDAAAAAGLSGSGDGAALPDSCYRTPSPSRHHQPLPLPHPTPITAAMSSAAWLQGAVVGQLDGPSPELRELLRAAGMDAASEARLAAAAQGLAAAVLPDCTAPLEGPLLALEQSTTVARRSQGLRLYWQVLERLLAAECAHPDAGPSAAAALLVTPLFHRCIAACAFECVLSSYRMANLAFPAVLERLHLPAFDLCKAVEPFVQQLPSLPRDLKRHMLSIEEKCLESLAWQQGSSLYPTLIAAVGTYSRSNGSSGAPSSTSRRASVEAVASGGGQEQQGAASGSPTSPHSMGNGGSSGRQVASLTPRKRSLEEMAAPAGAEVNADTAGTPPPGPRRGKVTLPVSTLGSIAQLHVRQPQQQQVEPLGHAQSGFDSEARLPLSLGSALLPGAGAGAHGASGDQQPVSTNAAGPALVHLPRGDRSARSAVSEFLHRLLKLAAIRLADLLSRLDVQPAEPQMLLTEAFTLAQHVAFEQTWLLYGRHLDQLLLCCLYSVCKLYQLGQVSFKVIIAAYKQQPQAQADTFKAVSMRPREQTSLHQLQPTATADIITFYNQVFIPHTRAFLMRLSENRSLLVQPDRSVRLYLRPQQAQQGVSGGGHRHCRIPSPPSLLVRGTIHPHPPSFQTPCLSPLAFGQHGSPTTRSLAGTPTHSAASGAANMLLLSPGAWLISRAGTTPLTSPRPDHMAGLRVSDSPALLFGTRSQPSTPLSSAAVHHMFGLPGGSSAQQPQPSPRAFVPAAAAVPGGTIVPPLMPPPVLRLMSDAAVHQMFANADAAAAAAAAAVMQVDTAASPPLQPGPRVAVEAEEEMELLNELPSESLPLLAAAAEAAQEIERKEQQVAAAFSNLRPGPTTPAAPRQQTPPPPHGVALVAATPPELAAAGRGTVAPVQQYTPNAQPQLPQPLLSPRHARRILAMQPSAVQ